jgi:hypothetical protein
MGCCIRLVEEVVARSTRNLDLGADTGRQVEGSRSCSRLRVEVDPVDEGLEDQEGSSCSSGV